MSTSNPFQQPQSSFFAGLEEFIARLVSFLITVLFFVIYVIAGGNSFTLNWNNLLGFLALFWLLYEFLSFLLFIAFRFFSSSQSSKKAAKFADTIVDDKTLDNPTENI